MKTKEYIKKQGFNPFLPQDEYIPDGEPHVFGNRVFLYGSHDAEGGRRFCERDYTVYSAPVDDLSCWTCHGISYKKSQDPRSQADRLVDLYAPDCVRGNDGRYYLYYSAMGPNVKNFGPLSVAVSKKPDGPFDYLGDIRWPDGTPMTMFLTNDPAVLNDNGRIWLYYGWGLGRDFRSKLFAPVLNYAQKKIFDRSISEIKATKPSIMSCAVVELESDMFTVKSRPKSVLDSKTTADKKSELYHHPFYEAASIRKFGDLYYLLYSSGVNCELAYATSKFPDRNFQYRGVIISNSDLGYQGNRQSMAAGGTIHGGIECINGEYYVFYHRCTHNTNFSRQACAERIECLPDGTIRQVEMTTQGLYGQPLSAKGIYPAVLCCNLFNRRTRTVAGNGRGNDAPNITHKDGERFITAINKGTTIGFKYFDFRCVHGITITVRGGRGTISVSTVPGGAAQASIALDRSTEWKTCTAPLHIKDTVHALYFVYTGSEKIDFLQFEIL
jgi:hypothetical protein